MGKIAKADLRRVFNGYRGITPKMSKSLNKMGFSIKKANNKHPKLFFQKIYCGIVSETGSDFRAGKNKVSEIWNKLPDEFKLFSTKKIVPTVSDKKKVSVLKSSDCFTLSETADLLETDKATVLKAIDRLDLWERLPKSERKLLIPTSKAEMISDSLK